MTIPPPWNGLAAGLLAIGVLAVATGRVRRPDLDAARRVVGVIRAAPARRPPAGSHVRGPSARGGRPAAGSRLTRPIAVILALSVAALIVAAANRPDGRVRVTVLDVGQGDAILVEGGRGGRLLVDGGPDPDRLLLALDARLPPWDRRIDLLVLSHPHEDHVAGLALLLDRYRVGRMFEPGMIGPGPGYRAWQAALQRLGIHPGTLATGDRFTLDDIRLRVLWPDRGAVPRTPADGGTAINNVSIVLLGEVGRQRFLLAGDIEEGIDPILLARGLPRVDLLKVAHHGSRTASTGAFLDTVRPHGRGRLGRRGQSVRPPGPGHPGAHRRPRRPGPPDRSRRQRRGDVRRDRLARRRRREVGGGARRPDRSATPGGGPDQRGARTHGRVAVAGSGRVGDRPRRTPVHLRDPTAIRLSGHRTVRARIIGR